MRSPLKRQGSEKIKLEKYLRKRAQSRPLSGGPRNPDEIRQVIIVPARGEYATLSGCLNSLAENPSEQCAGTWCVVVVNNPSPGESGAEFFQDNQRTLGWLKRMIEEDFYPFSLSYIDASSREREIPAAGGVGQARRIGADSVIDYLAREKVLTNSEGKKSAGAGKLLFHLDADTLCAPDYLNNTRCQLLSAQAQAGVVHFEHQPASSPENQQAIDRYELFMRCYVHGLRWAGSPYAFHTVGSTMVSTIEAYVRAGGIQGRQTAGEDFYFLQQLAKTGRVVNIGSTTVYPSARPSRRVLFGTGCHIADVLEKSKTGEIFDPPEAFEELRRLLRCIESNTEYQGEDVLLEVRRENWLAPDFLERRRFADVWRKFRHRCGKCPSLMKQAFHQWFDALATRQFIHAFTARRLSFSLAWPQWVELTGAPPRSSIREALEWLRSQDKRSDQGVMRKGKGRTDRTDRSDRSGRPNRSNPRSAGRVSI